MLLHLHAEPTGEISVASDDILKSVVTIPFGLFIRIPFDLRNAANTSQRSIDQVLHGLPFVCTYNGDLMVASWNAEEHTEHLVSVFDYLDMYGVVINPSKSTFGVPSLEFLGHYVDSKDNPRSSRPERRTPLVARELACYTVDIAVFSEARFSEQGELEEIGVSYTFFWGGRPSAERRDAGVAFAIRSPIA
nr:unnamed protein product [Spirometra erinaceieuropaei]